VQFPVQSDMLPSMVVLAFRHIAMEHLGWIGDALDEAAVEVHYIDLPEDATAHVSLNGVTGLIFLGGPMSVNEDLPYIRRELGLIDEALAAGKPVLGICLGAQLIAKALGARVYANPVKEIGWGPIRLTEAGHRDPLLGRLRDPEIVLHWHGETFDLPPGATWLAYSEACRHQAFRYGLNVYGLQFHLEATPEMIAAWCAAPANSADVAQLPAPIDPFAHRERMQELSRSVFGAWAGLVKGYRHGAGA
jgi:GMP synthase (glutamine-hydrolysing)